MTLLTPNFAEQAKTNGAAGAHIVAPHEPTRAGEMPPLADAPHKPTSDVAAAVAPQPLKVALIGTAPSSRMLAPFNDPAWQIWACSPGNMNVLPRVDVWYELHSNLLWPEHESYGKPYIEWLKQQKFPIFMQETWPSPDGQVLPLKHTVPNAHVFPKDELVAEFGYDFFTSSFAWMMAHAMKLGAVEIALYGIDMASRDEYILQRPGFFFFRHIARQRGIKVSAPNESDIMQSPALYAYVDSTPFGRKLMARRTEVQGRIGGMTQQRDGLNGSITYLQGALEDIDYMSSIWSGVANEMGLVQHENALLKAKVAGLMAPKMPLLELAPLTSNFTIQPVMSMATPPLKKTRRKRNQPESPAP